MHTCGSQHTSPYAIEPTRTYANIITPGYRACALGDLRRLHQPIPYTIAYDRTSYSNSIANQLTDAGSDACSIANILA